MVELQYPEFLLLAVPLAFLFWRWGSFAPAWGWLLLIAAWAAAAAWLWTPPRWSHAVLAIPVLLFLWPWIRRDGMTGVLRLCIVSLLLFALTGPVWNLGGTGVDVIVVADRSRSMPADSPARVRELIDNIESNRRRGDRVAVVTFGSDAHVEHDLSDKTSTEKQYLHGVEPDGSDLNRALLTALDLVDRNRPARVLVLSDGEANGADPTFAARRARELGVPIDFRLFERLRVGDVAVRELSLPESVAGFEPFQFSVEIQSDRSVSGTLTMLRDGETFATRKVELLPGSNRVPFRDVVVKGGLRQYEARLAIEGDPLTENNRGEGVVRVEAGPRLLLLNGDGQPGNLGRELQAAKIDLDVAAADRHSLTQDSLDGYRAVIIENIPAKDLGRLKMERLAQFVEDLGGGLMLTGGKRSFGSGGYFKSPLEELLPVSMEMREEHRKTRVAIAVALDRSGSMMATVAGGKTKMELADLGTAEVARLLSPGDSMAVIAVDSAPHVVQPLTDVTDPEVIAKKVLGIQSMGGGIFVYEALVAAGAEIAKAEQSTKHIILFSDAADSEEPGNWPALLKKFEASGVTVSVIGLGTERDVDAKLLKDIAAAGKGNILFTEDAKELPRLFTEDTMSVARSSFIEKDPMTQPDGIPGAMLPNARLMGDLLDIGREGFPGVDGYNLSYLKPDATVAVQSADEYSAPWSAFWYRGLGRVAAVTLEVDGQFSGPFGRWARYDDFLITHGRWLLGIDSPPDAYIDLRRAGQDAVVTVELDPHRPGKETGEVPDVMILPPGAERVDPLRPDLTWTGPDTLEARFRLKQTGSYRTVLVSPAKNGERPKVLRGPAVALPYSPEFDPRSTQTGQHVLAELARLSGGVVRTDVLDVFSDPPRSARTQSMLPWLFAATAILLVLEIAGRRLSLWEKFSDVATAAIPSPPAFRRWPKPSRGVTRRPRPESGGEAASAPTRQPEPAAKEAPPATEPAPPQVDVFAAAKNRARKRMR